MQISTRRFYMSFYIIYSREFEKNGEREREKKVYRTVAEGPSATNERKNTLLEYFVITIGK